MKKRHYIIVGVLLLALVFAGVQFLFIVNEGQQVVITRFGRVTATPITTAGLKLKLPFVDTIHVYSKKILSWNGQPKMLPTSDDKRILVDTTARWRISNAARFYATLSSPMQAYAKLDNIIDSRVRTVVGRYPMDEVVRSNNVILAQVAPQIGGNQSDNTDGEIDELNKYFTINPVTLGRSLLADEILNFSREEINTESLGIELVDMMIRQVRYPDSVAEKAYQRMASERRKRAALQRSTGEGAKAKWQGRLERERETILAEAEAAAASIYRLAYSRDPEFYRFWRALDSYQQALPRVSKIFSTNMEYFHYLYNPTKKVNR